MSSLKSGNVDDSSADKQNTPASTRSPWPRLFIAVVAAVILFTCFQAAQSNLPRNPELLPPAVEPQKPAAETPAETAPKEPGPDKPSPTDKKTFNAEEFLNACIFFSDDKDAKLEKTWKILKTNGNANESILVCLGHPQGYIRTKDVYENFEFGLEWRYPNDANGNSGILLHTSGTDTIWPDAIQVQLHALTAGSIFATGHAKSDNEVSVKDLSRPKNEWNTCVVTSRDGRISAVINGKKVGEVTGTVPKKGSIAIQSEDSEIHFRNIWLRVLEAEPAKAE